MTPDRLIFRQLLAGRDFAIGDPIAAQMVNFCYLIGDRETGDALVVDPAYRVGDLVEIAAQDGLTITGALVTHAHVDHVGGNLMGYPVEGLAELLARDDVEARVHVQRDEAAGVLRATGASESDLVIHASGDVVPVGAIGVHLIHTPGHTPGSQCFFVDNRLVAGDTLFLDSCGRTDFPGGDPEAMFESLTTRLAVVPDDAVLYPGHMYSADESATMGETRRRNYVYRFPTLEQWLQFFG